MNAADIMTRQPVSVTREATIVEAARLMLQHHISGLPVTDASGALVGIVTEGDLLHRAETGTDRHRPRWLEFLVGPGRLASDYVDTHARKVGEVMTQEVTIAAPGDELSLVVETMEKRHIRRLPVVEGGRLVGIVSRADLVRALVERLGREKPAGGGSDAEIRDQILAEINRQPWGPRFSVDVTVANGVAELNGTITDDRERSALVVAAENGPGVKQVRDRLVWVEPTSGMVIPAAK